MLIEKWFGMWLEGASADQELIESIFSKDIIYTECYGPQYSGTEQIKRWFREWNQRGRVIRWDIHRTTSQGDVYAVEWYFQCCYEGEVSGFDGVTIACFDAEGKILRLSEFQSKCEHYCPFE